MKKILLGFVALCLTGWTFGQKDLVSTLFDKYNGAEGITIVNVSGDMLKLLTQAEQERRDTVFTSKLTELRVLATDKSCDKPAVLDLRKEVYDKLDKSVYREMISVKEQGEDVVILVKEANGRISEMLIIAGGEKENALVQIKGDLLLSELAGMAGKFPMMGFHELNKMEK